MSEPRLLLAPIPRRIVRRPGRLHPRPGTIVVPPQPDAETLRCARHLRRLLADRLAVRCAVRTVGKPFVQLLLAPVRGMDEQGYRLRITREAVTIQAVRPVGLWYAVMTLAQLLARPNPTLPCIEIDDAPDFPHRGAMLDISRDKVPTMATLRRTIDWLASLKINQLQLYTEHTFAYRRHPVVWRGCSPLTPSQVRELDARCRERFIELVPNQNSLGHMERFLKHRRYAPLAEAIGPWRTPWGETRTTKTTLNPLDPRSLRLVASLYRDRKSVV